MKKIVLFTLMLGLMPFQTKAQDDMYSVTSQSTANKRAAKVKAEAVTYSGSNRDVDEYNRHGKYWSHYQKIGTDGKGNDVIEFSKGRGVYPDSAYIDTMFVGKHYDTMVDADEYRYTGRMSRWDGFYDPWFYSSFRWGAYPYWRAGWGWYDPWYYGYSGWYDPWYDPWYYGGYGFRYNYAWSYPYNRWYGYYGWGGYYPPVSYYRRGHAGTLGYYDRSNYGESSRRSYGSESYGYDNRKSAENGNRRWSDNRGDISFGSRRSTTPSTYERGSSTFGNSRSYTPAPAPNRSSGSFGGGSFGGSRGGGGSIPSGGGSRGGGTFGGGRR